MEKKIRSCYNSGIVYIKPEYREGMGDVTRVRTKTNSIVFKKNIQSTIKNIARFLFFDLDESKRYYKELLGKGKNLPLVFDEDNIFICVKSRIPTKRNDGAMTYINPKYIKGTYLWENSSYKRWNFKSALLWSDYQKTDKRYCIYSKRFTILTSILRG